MARTAFYAPAHRVANRNAPGNTMQSPDLAPNQDYGGAGIGDPRVVYNTLGPNGGVMGWYIDGPLIDAVPSTLSTTAIAAAQVPTAGTALTLVSATGAGITVLSAATTVFPSQAVVPAGALAIDGLPGLVKFGQNFITSFYDPTTMLARNIQIDSVGNDSTATFLVAGWDWYGYPMSEQITGANAGTATGKKAFKFVGSITPAGTLSGGDVSVGQGDTYGLPIQVQSAGYVSGLWNALTTIGAGTLTDADTTSPATSTTGDVRGTYHVGSASDGSKRLTLSLQPNMKLMQSQGMTQGLIGVTQA